MTAFRQRLKRLAPAPLWALGSNSYWWWYNRGQHILGRGLNPVWRANLKRLEAYRDIHQGKRCFLIGNGPSLRQTDLSLLQGEYTFGMNRIYLAFPELGFTSTYLVSVNDLVLEQCALEMNALALPKFVTWRARRWFRGGPDAGQTIFLDTDYTGPENFNPNAAGRLFEGFTVSYVSMQLAFFMGFSEVILIGVDHNFATKGTPNTTITSTGDDPNHFSPAYFGTGFRWQLPDLDGSERAYCLARQAYEQAGRQVVDATVGGKLTIFPKVDYRSLFS
jgi:hypothetical protein